MPTKQQKKFTISVVGGALVNFILNFILIRYYKSIGASIATVVSELLVTSIQFYLIRKEIKIKDVIKLSYKYFIASIIMFLVSVGIGILIKNNVLSIIIQVIGSCITYFFILIILKNEFILKNIDETLKKVTRKKELN